jgi:hypothetical protein
MWIQTGNHGETHRRWTPGVRPPPDELSVAFADEESPVYDEYVPGVLLELREHIGALMHGLSPGSAGDEGLASEPGRGRPVPKN